VKERDDSEYPEWANDANKTIIRNPGKRTGSQENFKNSWIPAFFPVFLSGSLAKSLNQEVRRFWGVCAAELHKHPKIGGFTGSRT
jgi:hypothetical protein